MSYLLHFVVFATQKSNQNEEFSLFYIIRQWIAKLTAPPAIITGIGLHLNILRARNERMKIAALTQLTLEKATASPWNMTSVRIESPAAAISATTAGLSIERTFCKTERFL